jgi:hypothetical protein
VPHTSCIQGRVSAGENLSGSGRAASILEFGRAAAEVLTGQGEPGYVKPNGETAALRQQLLGPGKDAQFAHNGLVGEQSSAAARRLRCTKAPGRKVLPPPASLPSCLRTQSR